MPGCPTTRSSAMPRISARHTSRTSAPGWTPHARSSRRPSVPDAPRSPYQYAVIRGIPRVERGDAMNVGVIVLFGPHRALAARLELDAAGLEGFAPELQSEAVRPQPDAIERM